MANVCAECAGRLFKYDAQLRRGRWRHLLRLKIRHEHCKCFSEVFLLFKKVVEAAGVEPASENVTGQETTCLVAFLPQALPWDVRGLRSERTRNASR